MKAWIGAGESGQLVDPGRALVSVFDHGFTVGDGIFETMKVVDGRIFLWPGHLERLHQSARIMRITLPSDDHLTRVARAVVEASDLTGTGRLRLTVTAGEGPLGSARDAVPPTVVCAMSAAPVRDGLAALHLVPWPRNERSPLAGVKSTSYAENVLALAAATASGADEAIFANSVGNLCEGSASNLFVAFGDRVCTPPLAAGVLAGVTRAFVIGLAGDGIEVVEQDIATGLLAAADEAFITSTFQDVRAVGRIDERVIPAGPVTAELARRFAERASDPSYWT